MFQKGCRDLVVGQACLYLGIVRQIFRNKMVGGYPLRAEVIGQIFADDVGGQVFLGLRLEAKYVR